MKYNLLNIVFGLLRVKQWYKNVVVFLVLFLTGNIFSISAWVNLLFAFIILCMISSASYIINDVVDRKKDALDLVKKLRPIASGKVSVDLAILVSIILLFSSIYLSYLLNPLFTLLISIMFLLTQIYTFWLKNKIFLDVIMIAINFMIRAISGAIVLNIFISSWFISGIFFVAMLMVFAKRYGESINGLTKNRKTLSFYTPELMKIFMIVFVSILILLYTFYVIINHDSYWFVTTIPIFTYLLLRYFAIVSTNPDLARHAEKLIIKWDVILPTLVWLIMFVFALYKFKGLI